MALTAVGSVEAMAEGEAVVGTKGVGCLAVESMVLEMREA